MAQLRGEAPDTYLPASAISKGGVYLTQTGRAYRVDAISEASIVCRLVRKSGGVSKSAHRGVYGVSVFFVEEVPQPVPDTPQPEVLYDGPWSRDGRLFYFEGKEAFSIVRHDIPPAEMDRMCARMARMLNFTDYLKNN